MAGKNNMTWAGVGLTDKELEEVVEKQYKDFCNYRCDLASNMPDRGKGLFFKRVFDGRYFERG